MIGTAAVLSEDRVTLTLGVGWSDTEFRLMGQEFARRGRRTEFREVPRHRVGGLVGQRDESAAAVGLVVHALE